MSYFNGEASHWLTASPAEPLAPSPLPAEKQDLVIVGGGLTGLWSAYCARRAHPDWEITIVEAEHIGYGASGRNGGWASTLLPGNRTKYAEAADCARRARADGEITIVEAEPVGSGAAGRNGGWRSTRLPGNRTRSAEAVDRARRSDPTGPVGSAGLDGVASVRAFQSALFDSID